MFGGGGTYTSFTQSVSDWITGYNGTGGTTAPGEAIAQSMSYYNYWNGSSSSQINTTNYVYGYVFSINSAKMVSSITLPANAKVKILAIDEAYLPEQVNLNAAPNESSPAFNLAGISFDSLAQYANLDGSNHSYSAKELGNTITWSSQVFNIGSALINDVVEATGQTINLPAGYLTNLMLLGAATNGVQSNLTFTVNYVGGSYSTFTQSVSDWITGYNGTGGTTAPGESIAKSPAYYNYWNGSSSSQINTTNYVYGYSFTVTSSKMVASITLPNDAKVKILAIDETYNGGGYLPALAIINRSPGERLNPIGGPNPGNSPSAVGPVPVPTSAALILGSISDADYGQSPDQSPDGQKNRINSIRLPVSSTGGLPSTPDVTVNYAVVSSPCATGSSWGDETTDPDKL